MKIAKVKWRDSAIISSQNYIESLKEEKICEFESVGFVLENTDDHITLTRDIIRQEARGTILIPNENIIKIDIIKEVENQSERVKHSPKIKSLIKELYEK